MSWITQKLKTMVRGEEPEAVRAKRKAFATFSPYVLLRERDGEQEVLDLIRDIFRSVAGRERPNGAEKFATALHDAMPSEIQRLFSPPS